MTSLSVRLLVHLPMAAFAQPRFSAVDVGRSEVGASLPLPSVSTKVRLQNRLPTLDLGGGDYSSCPRPCEKTILDNH
jgi:hypothetical protein